MAVQLADLLERARTYLSEDRLELVEQAYEFAAAQPAGQVRMSGERDIGHPLREALALTGPNRGSPTIAAPLPPHPTPLSPEATPLSQRVTQ